MTRDKYSMMMPILIIGVIASAFIISAFFPKLTGTFYLLYAAAGGVIILIIDRIIKQTLTEPVSDERLQGLSERSLWISWRIGAPIIMIAGFILVYGFSSKIELKFMGMGIILTVSFMSLLLGLISLVLHKRH